MITINGATVIAGRIGVPFTGAWLADVELTASVDPDEPVVMSDGSSGWLGTVVRSGVIGGRCMARVVGGSGGLSEEVGPAHYRAASAAVALGALLSEAGELQAPTILPSVLSASLGSWSRYRGTAGAALSDLSTAAGVTWRVTPEGMVWLGTGSYRVGPQSGSGVEILGADYASSRIELAVRSLALLPGDDLAGGKVLSVVYHMGEHFGATAWIDS